MGLIFLEQMERIVKNHCLLVFCGLREPQKCSDLMSHFLF